MVNSQKLKPLLASKIPMSSCEHSMERIIVNVDCTADLVLLVNSKKWKAYSNTIITITELVVVAWSVHLGFLVMLHIIRMYPNNV